MMCMKPTNQMYRRTFTKKTLGLSPQLVDFILHTILNILRIICDKEEKIQRLVKRIIVQIRETEKIDTEMEITSWEDMVAE